MKSLKEYIIEGKRDFYGTIIQGIEIDPNASEDALRKTLTEGINKAIDRYKIIRISAVEKANEESDIIAKKNLEDALKKGEQEIIKSMQSKPGILKRSPEKQRAWIDSKIEKLKSELGKKYDYVAHYCKIEFNDDDIRFGWHQDIRTEMSYSSYRGVNRLSDLVDDMVYKILKDKDFKHLKTIEALSKDFTSIYPEIHFFPTFDKDFEDELDKSVKQFGDFMSKEYSSGRYMGD